jgi:hypothetical protein
LANREEQVINAVCLNKDIQVLFTGNVDELFTAYGDIWDWLKDYYIKYRAVPDISVLIENNPEVKELEVDGSTAFYLDELRQDFVRGRVEALLMKAAHALEDKSSLEVLDKLQSGLSKLNSHSSTVADLDITDPELALEHYQNVRDRIEMMGGTAGIPTGIDFIDMAYPSGMMGGQLVMMIGWPSKGKSLVSTLMAANAFDKGFHPMMVSLEMNQHEQRDRLYTIMGSGLFGLSELSRGSIDTDDFRTFHNKRLAGKNKFTIVSHGGDDEITPNIIQSKYDQHKPDIIFVDYIQLMADNARTEQPTQRIMNISRQMKRLGMRNDIPVVMITSATQESTSDRSNPPTMAHSAWSKSMEYDAHLGYSVHKMQDSNLILITGEKNRGGALFAGYLDWDIERGKIESRFTEGVEDDHT